MRISSCKENIQMKNIAVSINKINKWQVFFTMRVFKASSKMKSAT
jgi:hypothetical protein